MASLSGFNAAEVTPSEGFDVLPAGEYRVCIVESSMVRTKKDDGDLIKLTLQVLDGQYQNRKIFEQLNWNNPSAAAQTIGRGTLSAICRAVGILTPTDTAELHNRPMRAKVKVGKDTGYGEKNEVVKYSPDKAGPQVSQPPSQQGHPTGASAWAATVGG